MSSARTVALIARREIVERSRARSFRGTTLLLAVLGVVLVLVLPRLDEPETPSYEVGVVAGEQSVGDSLGRAASAAGASVGVRPFAGEAVARAALEAGEVDAVVLENGDAMTLVVRESPAPGLLVALVDRAVREARVAAALAERGIPPGEAQEILAPPQQLQVEQLEQDRTDEEADETLGFLVAAALFVALLVYGSVIAAGVAEEKTNHVSAILLAVVRPSQLLAGKVAGIGLLSLGQLVLVALPALVAAVAAGSLDLPTATPRAVGGMLLWFVLGYLLYSTAFAALGALVARSEEVGSATLPITVLLTVGYFLALEIAQDPTTALARVVSLLPPFAPLAMPVRIGAGSAAAWEVALAALLTLATALGLIRVGARVYSRGVAATGPRLRLQDVWRQAG